MYQALYRKYRPRLFSDVAGQEHITEVLCRQVEEGRTSHAYLFTGSRGTGKTTCAKILAKAVNCLNPCGGQPCGVCEMCAGIDSGSETDIVEIDAASNNSVDNIRDLRSTINYTPSSAKYRVYIIDEVHMLSTGAFNALLKTLEEPPEYVIFILATTEIHKLPATILSRCQRFDFRRLSPDIIAQRVKYVCNKEGLSVSEDAALLIGRLADGALRDALSLLDVCAAHGQEIDEKLVMSSAGMAGKEKIFELASCFIERNAGGALDIITELYNSSHDMQRLCSELMSHYRDLMVAVSLKDYGRLVNGTSDGLRRIKEQADKAGLNTIMHTMTVLTDTMEAFRSSSAPLLVQMEMAAVKICSDTLFAASPSPSVFSEAGPLMRGAEVSGHTCQAVSDIPVKKAKAEDNASAPSGNTNDDAPPWEEKKANPSLDADSKIETPPLSSTKKSGVSEADNAPAAPAPLPDGVYECDKWPDIMDALAPRNRAMHAVLMGSKAYIKGDILLIDAKNSLFRDMIKSDTRHKSDIRAAAKGILGREFRLGPYNRDLAVASPVSSDPLDALGSELREAGFEVK